MVFLGKAVVQVHHPFPSIFILSTPPPPFFGSFQTHFFLKTPPTIEMSPMAFRKRACPIRGTAHALINWNGNPNPHSRLFREFPRRKVSSREMVIHLERDNWLNILNAKTTFPIDPSRRVQNSQSKSLLDWSLWTLRGSIPINQQASISTHNKYIQRY